MNKIEMAVLEYADGLYEPTDRGVLYRETQVDFIAGVEWQAKQSPWISVKDRLPDFGINVFVRTTNKKYGLTSMYIPKDCQGNILGDKEWHGSGVFKGSITHWMYIPY